MQTYEALPGEHIDQAIQHILDLAHASGEPATMRFNEIDMTTQPDDTLVSLRARYDTACAVRQAAYLASPEYLQQQREATAAQARRAEAHQKALATAPAQLTVRDTAAWEAFSQVNTDPYGARIVRFADEWARLMEARLATGETIASCAQDTATLANDDGITGYMYGCAVSILAQCWAHGEALRRWHNHTTQLHDEGDRANAEGGVLNPALLRIGPK